MKCLLVLLLTTVLMWLGCHPNNLQKMSIETLRDKIAGGWAGKMIGVAYGAPTEFRAQGRTYDDPIAWQSEQVKGSLWQDDLYVQMSFMMTMDKYGIDAPAEKFAESFAKAGYRLWHANVQARKNFQDDMMPPASGSPQYNLHADDIDFQIEADYIGFMCPGMPQTANAIADKIGHIMNYGDGVYGGMFVAALYTTAYFQQDIPAIVETALQAIPAESDYSRCIRHVLQLKQKYPQDWRQAWQELESLWGHVDICGALSEFNIDAKLNGAYIVMGLLYGDGDLGKTMEISTRCGQDSDCNPSNAAAVIGVLKGYSAMADSWKSGIPAIADSQFIFTDYSFNGVVERTLHYAKELIVKNGGQAEKDNVYIKVQRPAAPALQVSFPNTVADKYISALQDNDWRWTGAWQDYKIMRGAKKELVAVARVSDEKDASLEFTFTGNGVVLKGDWRQDGGQADVYLDGALHRRIDTHYFWAGEPKHDSFLWHAMNLGQGTHTVKLVVTASKKTAASGCNIYITGATIFRKSRGES
jgi:hypothetical protein